MPDRPMLYYITDSTQFPGDAHIQRQLLLEKIAEATQCGVNFVQLREKMLSVRELEGLTCTAAKTVHGGFSSPRRAQPRTKLLVNSRTDVAMACCADGVHLRSDDIFASEVRNVWRSESIRNPIISISCHSSKEVEQAAEDGADYALFGPVFEKRDAPMVEGAGIARLRQACQFKIPVFALGGITVENASSCIDAGAAGISGIRLFQENDIAEVVKKLRF